MSGHPHDWNSGSQSGIVSIGTHSLFLTASDPTRVSSTTSAVVIEAGASYNPLNWTAFVRLISPFARIYSYDRAGLGCSEESPGDRTADAMAHELSSLLKVVNVVPPYVLVGHSFGGIVAREFLALRRDGVVGVLGDSSHKELLLRDTLYEYQRRSGKTIMVGLNYLTVNGLASTHKYTSEEWEEFLES